MLGRLPSCGARMLLVHGAGAVATAQACVLEHLPVREASDSVAPCAVELMLRMLHT